MLIDCHNHSKYSHDAEFSIEQMCKSAQINGIDVFSITDHCDVNSLHYVGGDITRQSIKGINLAKQNFDIKIIAGIELGQYTQNKQFGDEILKIKGIDFVIGSLHNIKGQKDFYYLDYSDKESTNKILQQYYIEYLQLANTSTYDVLGHLTYPYRYIRQRGESYPIIDEALAEIMKAAIRQGKGIEINTSTPEFTLPLKKHLQLYKDLGGEIVSVGSDSHSPQRVGTGIKLGHQILKEVGFKYATYFEKRNPVFVKI